MDAVKIILENKLTAENAADLVELLADHDELIREMALYVLQDKAGKGDERAALLGAYAAEVQNKVNWTIKAAKDVWAGVYGNDADRVKALGADYDLVMYRVNQTKTVTVPAGYKYDTDNGGKRYVLKNFPTSKGAITWKGYPQHSQGSNVFKFDHNGCGFMSIYALISTIKGYDQVPATYATAYLKSVTGTAVCPISLMAGMRLLDKEGINYEWVRTVKTAAAYNDILLHLQTGNPVLVSLSHKNRNGNGTEDNRYTEYAHYAVLIGVTSNGKGYLLDSGSKKPRLVSLYDLCDHIPAANSAPVYAAIWNGWQNAGGYLKINM